MKKQIVLVFLLLIGLVSHSQTQLNNIRGRVTDGLNPIAKVDITIKNTDTVVQTDAKGLYTIEASPGQELVFSFIGMEPVEVVVEDVTNILNIELLPKIEELDEVVISSKRKTQRELYENYNIDKQIIRTANGFLDSRRVGFRTFVIQGSQLSLGSGNILDIIATLVPGSLVIENEGIVLNRARGSSINSVPQAIFDVDGVITDQAPLFLDRFQIERLAILPSLGGTNIRYGTLAVGGVIVINTKLGNFSPPATGAFEDQARLRNNFFEEGSTISVYNAGIPAYLEALRASGSKQEALALFTKQRATYGNYADHVLDSFDYFSKTWNDADICADIAKNIETDFAKNPVVLKSLAYMFEERKDYESAESLYKKIFVLRPNYAQSYMDLANVYRSTGRTDNAASIYARFDYLVDKDLFDPSDNFTPVLTRDFHNLVVLNSDKLKRKDRKKLDVGEAEFKGTRLVFEWSDSEAEFELQFVNPEKQYHTWKHTYIDNPDRIKDEKKHGYSSEEYLIYGPFEGSWTINVNYMGNKKLSSTYLKATVYHNYGTKQQRKESKVFKLRLKDVNQKLFSVDDSLLYAIN